MMSHFLLVPDHHSHEELCQKLLGGSCPCSTWQAAEMPNRWITFSWPGDLPHWRPQQWCLHISPEVRWLWSGDLGLLSSLSLILAPDLPVPSKLQPSLQQAGSGTAGKILQELAYGIKLSLAGLQRGLTAEIFAHSKHLGASDEV